MHRTTRRRTVMKAAGLIASMALLASASSAFASENPHVVTWQLPSGAWSGHGDFFHLTDRSYGFSGPVKQSETFPQTLVGEGQLTPACGEWAQVDFYKVTTANQQALYDSLIEGKVLGWNNGPADSSIYSGSQGYGFYFVYGGDCQQETTQPTQEPTQEPTATPSDGCTCTEAPTATPTQEPTQEPTATPSDGCTCTEAPTATPTQEPTATPSQEATSTPSQEPTATPTGSVETATGTPSITLPPTSTVDVSGPTGGGDGGLPIAVLALIGLTALIILITPTPARARRRIDRD